MYGGRSRAPKACGGRSPVCRVADTCVGRSVCLRWAKAVARGAVARAVGWVLRFRPGGRPAAGVLWRSRGGGRVRHPARCPPACGARRARRGRSVRLMNPCVRRGQWARNSGACPARGARPRGSGSGGRSSPTRSPEVRRYGVGVPGAAGPGWAIRHLAPPERCPRAVRRARAPRAARHDPARLAVRHGLPSAARPGTGRRPAVGAERRGRCPGRTAPAGSGSGDG
jgi:hypothetical protein